MSAGPSRSVARIQRFSAFVLVATIASNARAADEKQVCVRAVERAQIERLDGKLRAARDGFVMCARAVCPDAIRADCTRWVTEVEASLPTIVIDARWADGRDVAGLTVMLDGQLLPDAAGGRAVALDPGAHALRFEAPGAAPVETRSMIREGEKNRILHVTFSPADPLRAPAVPVVAPTLATPPSASTSPAIWRPEVDETARSGKRPIPTSAFVVGGFALLGFAGFAYAGLSGVGQLDHLRATCVHSCNPSDVDSARREILVGDIIGIAALVAAGVTAWLVLTRPTLTR